MTASSTPSTTTRRRPATTRRRPSSPGAGRLHSSRRSWRRRRGRARAMTAPRRHAEVVPTSSPTTAYRTAAAAGVLARAAAAPSARRRRRRQHCSGRMAGRGPGSAPCSRTGISTRAGTRCWRCISGRARIGFGGDRDDRRSTSRSAMSASSRPASATCRLDASRDFRMAGGYPPGQKGNIVRPGDLDGPTIGSRDRGAGIARNRPDQRSTDGSSRSGEPSRRGAVSTSSAPVCGSRRRS